MRSLTTTLAFSVLLALGLRAQSPLLRALEENIPAEAGTILAEADIDHDFDVDPITSTGAYLNDGNGRFSLHPTSFAFSFGLHTWVAVGDVNGDGTQDLVSIAAGAVRIDANQGGGVFLNVTPALPVLTGGVGATFPAS